VDGCLVEYNWRRLKRNKLADETDKRRTQSSAHENYISEGDGPKYKRKVLKSILLAKIGSPHNTRPDISKTSKESSICKYREFKGQERKTSMTRYCILKSWENNLEGFERRRKSGGNMGILLIGLR